MDDLSPEEQSAFKAMQQQEPVDRAALKAEKEPVEQVETETPREPVEPKMVPLSAVQEERERRKAAEEKARQSELNQARLDERIKAINERLQPPQQPKEIPDPEKDALGSLKATADEVRELKRYQEQHQAQLKQHAVVNQIMSQASAKEAEFMKDTPDYGDASAFLRNSRFNELVALGQDPFAANNAIVQESLALAASALQQGKNPAEMIYQFAKARGYAKTTSVQSAQPEGDAAKLARIAEGQKANTSLGNAPSTPSKPPMDGKALLALDDDEFAKFLENLPEKKRANFMGA